MFRLDEPRANLHVYGLGSAEAARHRLFRDWLRETPADVARYAEAKRSAAVSGPQTAMAYDAGKAAVVREIYARAFIQPFVEAAAGQAIRPVPEAGD